MILMESALSGMKRILSDQLPIRLAAIQTAIGDGIPLDAPKSVIDYMPRLGEVSEFPFVAILGGPTTPTADQGQWMMADNELAICYFIQDADPLWLSRKLLRYQRAIIEVLVKNRVGVLDQDGASAWTGLNVTRTEPGDRFTHASNPSAFTDYGIVYADAIRSEDFSP